RDQIVLPQTGPGCGCGSLGANYSHAARVCRKFQEPSDISIDVLGLDAEEPAGHPTSVDQLGQNRFQRVDRNREAQPLGALQNESVDAYDLSLSIQERAS